MRSLEAFALRTICTGRARMCRAKFSVNDAEMSLPPASARNRPRVLRPARSAVGPGRIRSGIRSHDDVADLITDQRHGIVREIGDAIEPSPSPGRSSSTSA
jgi:hypothetical protein